MSPPASHRRRSRLLSWPLFFVAILVVHSLAVYLFTRGFLLTRTELDLHSSRDDRPPQGDVSTGCASWPPPAVDRLVIIVLDALRWPVLGLSSSTSLVVCF
jgi:phosphatidylinositol glycan class O